MTGLEIILLAIIWLSVGCYICFKRDWYPQKSIINDAPAEVSCAMAIIFAPVNLAIVLFKLFFIYKWTNNN